MTAPPTSSAPARPRTIDGAVPFGLALIVLGVLLALDNLEVVDASDLLAGWWPLAVVAAGIWWSVTGSLVSGLATVTVGGMLLVATLGVVELPLGRLVFPGILVIVGGALLQAGVRLRVAQADVDDSPPAGTGRAVTAGGDPPTAGDRLLAGPTATAVFGDARLVVGDDGRDIDRLVVTTTAVFGDVRVEVPSGWRLEDRITRLLGDVTLPREQPSYPESPVVVLHGLVALGDVRVRYAELLEGGR